MIKFIVIQKDSITKEDQLENKATFLFSGSSQKVLRLSDTIENKFTNYIKYSADQIKAARENKSLLKERFDKIIISKTNPFSEKSLLDGSNLFKRLHGSDYMLVDQNSMQDFEIEIGYNQAKLEAMEVVGAGVKHSVSVFILDSEEGAYSGMPRYVLNQFAFDAAVKPVFHRFYSKYDADLYAGMIVRVEVYNQSDIASNVAINTELNEVRK